MSPDAIQSLLTRKPELKPSRAKLEAMQAGAYCIHRSWGFGQIDGFDEASGKLIINFEGKPGHAMDPAFCVTTLEVLPAAHILVRRQTEPEVIQKLINEDPAGLVRDILATYPNRAATSTELEAILTRLLGEERFKRWWSAARKAVARDSRVGVPAKKGEVYFLREQEVSLENDLIEQFNGTRSARRRIQLAEELLKAARENDDAKSGLPAVLEGLATAVRDSNQLTDIEKLTGAWIRDDLALLIGEDPSVYEPSLATLVGDHRRLPDLAENIPVAYQARLLGLIREVHAEQWRELIINLLKNSKGKFTAECINFLVEHDCGEELAETFRRWQTEQNFRAPVLLWIAKNRGSRKYARLLEGLVSPRLLSSIFYAVDLEALQTAGTRRIQLAEYLADDQQLIPDLLEAADQEMARDLANQLMMNQGFEELTKKSLMARFIKQFPAVQSLVSGESEERAAALIVSRESYTRRQSELEDLISRQIPENSRAIAAAREHGDLRENSEYKMAKQDQSVLMARKSQLEADLGRAQITDFTDASTDVVSVGTIVTLSSNGTRSRYTVLGAWDSDPEHSIISYKTALGTALLGRKVGDAISIREGSADRVWVIESIEKYAVPAG